MTIEQAVSRQAQHLVNAYHSPAAFIGFAAAVGIFDHMPTAPAKTKVLLVQSVLPPTPLLLAPSTGLVTSPVNPQYIPMPRAALPSTMPSPTPSMLCSCTRRVNTLTVLCLHFIVLKKRLLCHCPFRGRRQEWNYRLCQSHTLFQLTVSAHMWTATQFADLFFLSTLCSKSVVQGCRGDPAAKSPKDPTSSTQNTKVAKEA